MESRTAIHRAELDLQQDGTKFDLVSSGSIKI